MKRVSAGLAKTLARGRQSLSARSMVNPPMKNLFCVLLAAFVAGLAFRSHAGLLEVIGLGKQSTNATTTSAALSALSPDQLTGGLKEALSNGLQHAVAQLGHDGGFTTNLNVKIPMPEKLRTVEKTLRTLKQDKLADDFVATMNRAAEQAVPEAAAVFADAIRQLTIADARTILTGTNDAATQYFRRTTQTNLFARFHPIVQKATAQAGVTAAYKNMLSKATGGNVLGKSIGGLLGQDAMDVDTYVTNKTLDGLFKMVADEEKQIRENPLARTTGLLQKVFGAAAK
jgi:hypothetical protein